MTAFTIFATFKRDVNLDFRAEKLIAFPKQNMQYISGVKVDGNDK